MRHRYQRGSLELEARPGRAKVWYFRWTDADGRRRSERLGTQAELPTKAKAAKAAEKHRALAIERPAKSAGEVTFSDAALAYMASDRFPANKGTADGYRNNIENHCRPKWDAVALKAIQPLEVEHWLKSLEFAGKTKGHIRSAMHLVYDFAMFSGMIPVSLNPIELVRVKGSSTREREPVVISQEQFAAVLANVTKEPHRTMWMVAMALGIRRSEVSGLQWGDIEHGGTVLHIKRRVLGRTVEKTKTPKSKARNPLCQPLYERLMAWRGAATYNKDTDWIWASPYKAYEWPYDLGSMWTETIKPAMTAAGLYQKGMGWHTLRHSYRAWLEACGTKLEVQMRLMRHSNLAMTMKYGIDPVTDAMREANDRIGKMVVQ